MAEDLDPRSLRTVEALVAQYAAAQASLIARSLALLLRALRGASRGGALYDEATVVDFARGAATAVRTAQVTAAGTTAGYLDQVLPLVGVSPPRPAPTTARGATAPPPPRDRVRTGIFAPDEQDPLSDGDLEVVGDPGPQRPRIDTTRTMPRSSRPAVQPAPRIDTVRRTARPARARVSPMPEQLRPVDPLAQWERPAEQYRYARSVGADDEAAIEAAVARATRMLEDDLALAARDATVRHLENLPAVRGYRRVIRPELSRDGTCALCIAASNQVYSRGELMPLHGRCYCVVLPLPYVGPDPGASVNASDLARLYQEAGSTAAAALKRTRYKVTEHGELGPVLSEAGHSRLTPQQAQERGTRAAPARAKAAGAASRAAADPRQKPVLFDRAKRRGQIAQAEVDVAALRARQGAGEDVAAALAANLARLERMRSSMTGA